MAPDDDDGTDGDFNSSEEGFVVVLIGVTRERRNGARNRKKRKPQ